MPDQRSTRLDGLNKELSPWDTQYYMGEFRNLCNKEKMNELGWPMRDYVVQIARFDPSKGIPNLIDSYARFRKLLEEKAPSLPNDDPAVYALAVYDFLTWLQETLAHALTP